MGCDITPVITRLLSRRFNSRSPSGLRQKGGDVVSFVLEFQFTQPKWAATCGGKLPRLVGVFQFTQPKRAATTSGTTSRHVTSVSIHAAQAGCDIIFLRIEFDFIVSIHAAQAGCDCRCAFFYFPRIEFQFTQPKRAATVRRLIRYRGCIRFNSRSPSGLRRGEACHQCGENQFQFTQPKWAATRTQLSILSTQTLFQFTQPKWAATTLYFCWFSLF